MDPQTSLLAKFSGCISSLHAKRKPKAVLDSDCFLLQAPDEFFWLIADELPAGSRLILRQTCTALRNILDRHYSQNDNLALWHDREVMQTVLYCMARDRPNIWVCGHYLRFHQNSRDVSPSARVGVSSCCAGHIFHRQDMQALIIYQQAHVQLALKYARHGNKLDVRSKTHQTAILRRHWVQTEITEHDRGSYYAIPRIVAGRFLVYREHTYERNDRFTHQIVNEASRSCCEHHFRSANAACFRFLLHSQIQGCPRTPRVLQFVCRFCKTEIHISHGDRTIQIRLWEDFGTEYSATYPNFLHANADEIETMVRERYESTIPDINRFYPQSQPLPGPWARPQDEPLRISNTKTPRRDRKKTKPRRRKQDHNKVGFG